MCMFIGLINMALFKSPQMYNKMYTKKKEKDNSLKHLLTQPVGFFIHFFSIRKQEDDVEK